MISMRVSVAAAPLSELTRDRTCWTFPGFPLRHARAAATAVAFWMSSAYRASMSRAEEWVLLSYRLPREPSTVRVTVWRRLKRLGVAQVLDGLVALPADARTREQLEWIADEVLAAKGEATIWLARPGSRAQEQAFARKMTQAVAADYAAVSVAAREALDLDDVVRSRTVARLRRELARIRSRDFFPPADRERAQRAVERLATSVGKNSKKQIRSRS